MSLKLIKLTRAYEKQLGEIEKILLNEETEARYALAVCYLALIEEVEKDEL